MIELLEKLSSGAAFSLDMRGFLICLTLAFVFSLLTELMYVVFYENRGTGSQIHRGFLLIGPAITLLFICVQLSLPLSLGLLGALSIVRFRTPIKEPEEIGFIMLLIAASIGIATFNFMYIILLYAALIIALTIKKILRSKSPFLQRKEGILMLNMKSDVYNESGDELASLLKEMFSGLRVDSISSVEGSTNIQYVFNRMSAPSWSKAQQELQSKIPVEKINIFFSRPSQAV